jgi:hypothetical protein
VLKKIKLKKFLNKKDPIDKLILELEKEKKLKVGILWLTGKK